jgi:hypothetical protein
MEMVTCLLKLGIVIHNCSHSILATEDLCTIDSPSSDNDLNMPGHDSRPFAMDRTALNYIMFANLIQKIQITQFHNAEICGTVNGLVRGD